MRSFKTACVALCLSGLLSSLGCCYHAQHFGRKRDIGWGEIGCATCDSCDHGDQCAPIDGGSHTIVVPVNKVR
ncbi:MAG: hypothetical protein L0Y71_06775 [Gemmataceae bacterium]|nr:hypothetical protein [Gemmataceae bacterium]